MINVQYANIGCQVKFIDKIKYYQKSLSFLAKYANKAEKINIRQSCRKFIEKNETYSLVFNSLLEENKNSVLDYLCGEKGVIPYEKIKTHKDLDCVPEGKFFGKTEFYSSLRNEIIGNDDYENVKKFWEIVHLKKLSKLNDIYNFRDKYPLQNI